MLVKHINNLFHCRLQVNAKFNFLIDAITESCRKVIARSLKWTQKNKYTIICVVAYLQFLINKPLLDIIWHLQIHQFFQYLDDSFSRSKTYLISY